MCDPSLRKNDIYSTAPEGFTRRMLASFFQLWFWYGGGGGRRAFTDLRLIHFHCHCQFALWHLFRPIIIADSYSSFRSCLRRSHLLIATYGNGSHLAPPPPPPPQRGEDLSPCESPPSGRRRPRMNSMLFRQANPKSNLPCHAKKPTSPRDHHVIMACQATGGRLLNHRGPFY